jgi:hypothetical protein
VLEKLECRSMLSVVSGASSPGLAFSDVLAAAPPNPQIAVGPSQIVEMVNNGIAIYSKSGALLAKATLRDALAGLSPGPLLVNPQVTYDDIAGRFVIAVLDIDPATQNSQLDLLITRGSDLTQGISEVHKIDLDQTIDFNNVLFYGSSVRMGWNYDSYVFSFSMTAYPNQFIGGVLPVPQIVTIQKSSLLDGNLATLNVFREFNRTTYPTQADPAGPTFLLNAAPVVMHGSGPGDPMLFVKDFVQGHQDQGFPFPPPPTYTLDRVDLYTAANLLSDAPTFTQIGSQTLSSQLGGDPATPPATQPDGSLLKSGDTHIANAVVRNNHLVFALNVDDGSGGGGPAVAWSDWDLATLGSGLVYQTGVINPANAYAFDPAIDIALNGDIGITYLQSGPNEFLSAYITGRSAGDPANTLQTPRLLKAGEAIYKSIFDMVPHLIVVNGNQTISLDPPLGYPVGQFGGVAVDPVNGSFWAANEYATAASAVPQALSNWGTWIGNFAITPAAQASPAPQAKVTSLILAKSMPLSRSPIRSAKRVIDLVE